MLRRFAMPHRSLLAPLVFALVIASFAAARPASAQPAPWASPAVPPPHTVPLPPPPRVDAERAAQPHATPTLHETEAEVNVQTRPLSPGRVVGQISAGWFAGAGGGLLGGLWALPAFQRGNEGLACTLIYGHWALASTLTVWGVGRRGHADGSLLATALGAVTGAFLGGAFEFWVLRDPPRDGVMTLVTGTLITAGAVIGYGVSASSAAEIEAAREERHRSSSPTVTPDLTVAREGFVLGASGTF